MLTRVRAALAAATAGITGPIGVLLLAAAALAALPAIRIPAPDLDSSWIVGITTAISDGMSFGGQVVFTYGPWANLDLLSGLTFGQVFAAFLFWAISGVAFVLIAWRIVSAWLSPVLAALVVALIGAPVIAISHVQSGFSGRVLLICTMLALAFAARTPVLRLSTGWLVALGIAASLSVQVKFSNGVLALATLGLIAVLAPNRTWSIRLRAVGVVAATAILTTLAAWLIGGQSLSTFPGWLRGSLELTSGYSEAMAVTNGSAGQFVLLAGIVAAVIVLLALSVRSQGWNWVLIVLVMWAGFVSIRLGFTRQDDSHVGQTFLLLTGVLLAIGLPYLRGVSIAAVAVCASLVFAIWSTPYFSVVDPATWGQRAFAGATALTSSGERGRLGSLGAAGLRDFFDLEPSIQRDLKNKSVHVDPFDTSVAWAYGLDWNPAPIFQSYSVYTPYLDSINAAAIRSTDGPDAVLKAAHGTIDGRNVLWEAPHYTLELFCGFVPGVTSGNWMVLDRTDPHCDKPVDLGTVEFTAGDTITVPKAAGPDSIVVASFSIADPLTDRVARAVFKQPSPLVVTTADGPFRLPLAHAAGPLIMRIPASAEWGAAFGGTTNYSTLTVSEAGTVTFSSIELTR